MRKLTEADEPGFWNEFVEPTPLARAIQFPLADPLWQDRVIAGYAARPAGRAKLAEERS